MEMDIDMMNIDIAIIARTPCVVITFMHKLSIRPPTTLIIFLNCFFSLL